MPSGPGNKYKMHQPITQTAEAPLCGERYELSRRRLRAYTSPGRIYAIHLFTPCAIHLCIVSRGIIPISPRAYFHALAAPLALRGVCVCHIERMQYQANPITQVIKLAPQNNLFIYTHSIHRFRLRAILASLKLRRKIFVNMRAAH